MLLLLLLFIILNDGTEEAITYFPPDPSIQFSEAKTELKVGQATGADQYKMHWKTASCLEEEVYLRQDVTLLYMDGQLKALRGLWKEHEKDISLDMTFEESDSSLFKAITFHHGEIHYPNEEIKSIQKITSDFLYVVDSPHTPLMSFRDPASQEQKEWKETIDHATSQQLHYVWKEWIDKKGIDTDRYDLYRLTDLDQFEQQPIDGLTPETSDRVIGQLWEGLYKNYILPLANDENHHTVMPLILIDKQRSHLMVLFSKDNDQIETLYQKISL